MKQFIGCDLLGNEIEVGGLRLKYQEPPFTVLDTRGGSWRSRRDEWKSLGIKSELGRDQNLTFSPPGQNEFWKDKQLRHANYKRCLAMAQVLEHVCPITNRKAKWRDRWHHRWLELAEKFKEAKYEA